MIRKEKRDGQRGEKEGREGGWSVDGCEWEREGVPGVGDVLRERRLHYPGSTSIHRAHFSKVG